MPRKYQSGPSFCAGTAIREDGLLGISYRRGWALPPHGSRRSPSGSTRAVWLGGVVAGCGAATGAPGPLHTLLTRQPASTGHDQPSFKRDDISQNPTPVFRPSSEDVGVHQAQLGTRPAALFALGRMHHARTSLRRIRALRLALRVLLGPACWLPRQWLDCHRKGLLLLHRQRQRPEFPKERARAACQPPSHRCRTTVKHPQAPSGFLLLQPMSEMSSGRLAGATLSCARLPILLEGPV